MWSFVSPWALSKVHSGNFSQVFPIRKIRFEKTRFMLWRNERITVDYFAFTSSDPAIYCRETLFPGPCKLCLVTRPFFLLIDFYCARKNLLARRESLSLLILAAFNSVKVASDDLKKGFKKSLREWPYIISFSRMSLTEDKKNKKNMSTVHM